MPNRLAGEPSPYVHEGEHNAPLCNLFVPMLQGIGVETDSFGQSSGTLTWS